MVFNATDKVLAVRPGTKICKADMAFEDPGLTQKYNNRIEKMENNAKITRDSIENNIITDKTEKLWDKLEKTVKQKDKINKSPNLKRKIKRLGTEKIQHYLIPTKINQNCQKGY